MKFCLLFALGVTIGQTVLAEASMYECREKNGYYAQLILSEASNKSQYVGEECTSGYYGESNCTPGYLAGSWLARTAMLKLIQGAQSQIFHFKLTRNEGDQAFYGYVDEGSNRSSTRLSIASNRDESMYTIRMKNTSSLSDTIELVCSESRDAFGKKNGH